MQSFYRTLLFFVSFGSLSLWAWTWSTPVGNSGKQEFEVQLDLYYSAVDYIFSLTDDPIPSYSQNDEKKLYATLVQSFLKPRFALLELSLNPMPYGGALLKEHASDFYKKGDWGEVNVYQALTEGMPEPWAFSLFWGGINNFHSPQADSVVTGKGFSGFLFNAGNYHLLANEMIPSYWLESEWKLKGTDLNAWRSLSWSFRVGYKKHWHPEITDFVYVGVKRSRSDYQKVNNLNPLEFFFKNSEMEFLLYVTPELNFTNIYILGGKKWVWGEKKQHVVTLSMGLQRLTHYSYSGELREQASRGWSLIFRPNYEF
jgi:hypothetical protein